MVYSLIFQWEGRQEDTIPIFPSKLDTTHVMIHSLFMGTVIKQFLKLFVGRHTPFSAPLQASHIILRTADVLSYIMARFPRTVTMNIITPLINTFFIYLTPSIKAAAIFGRVGSYVATCPLCPTGQSKIYRTYSFGCKIILIIVTILHETTHNPINRIVVKQMIFFIGLFLFFKYVIIQAIAIDCFSNTHCKDTTFSVNQMAFH